MGAQIGERARGCEGDVQPMLRRARQVLLLGQLFQRSGEWTAERLGEATPAGAGGRVGAEQPTRARGRAARLLGGSEEQLEGGWRTRVGQERLELLRVQLH